MFNVTLKFFHHKMYFVIVQLISNCICKIKILMKTSDKQVKGNLFSY
jgi:hypothetical protein